MRSARVRGHRARAPSHGTRRALPGRRSTVPSLVVGPQQRHVGETDATIWVETDADCEIEVLGHRARTFRVAGHHYGIVIVHGLSPGAVHTYEVSLDGERRWPEPESPESVIRPVAPGREFRLAFGSCRVSAPRQP